MPDWFRHCRCLLWHKHFLITDCYGSGSTARRRETFGQTGMLPNIVDTCCRSTVVATVNTCPIMQHNLATENNNLKHYCSEGTFRARVPLRRTEVSKVTICKNLNNSRRLHPAHKNPVVVPVSLSFVRAPAYPSYPGSEGHKTVVHSWRFLWSLSWD